MTNQSTTKRTIIVNDIGYVSFPRHKITFHDGLKLKANLSLFLEIGASHIFKFIIDDTERTGNHEFAVEFTDLLNNEDIPDNYAVGIKCFLDPVASSAEDVYWRTISRVFRDGSLGISMMSEAEDNVILFEFEFGKLKISATKLASELTEFIEIPAKTQEDYVLQQ